MAHPTTFFIFNKIDIIILMKNLAFIDGQNLHLGTKEEGWKVDLGKFRIYLNDKYKVKEAYYYLGKCPRRLGISEALYSHSEIWIYSSIQRSHW